MGVPQFFGYLLKQYKKHGFVFNRENLAKMNATNNTELLNEINNLDFLLIDANCLIHPVCFKVIAENPDLDDKDKLESRMIVAVLEYLDHLIKYVGPKEGVYIAIDGVAPVAKIKQQRMRRFKSVADKNMWDNIKKRFNRPIHNHWNNNAITPGTEFMVKLHTKIIEWTKTKNYTTIYSSCFTPAEGEHKLLQFIRMNQRGGNDYSYVVYGLDADLIFLALSTNSDKIYLLREANEINKNESHDVLNYVSIRIMRRCIVETITEHVMKDDDNMLNMDDIKLAGFKLDPDRMVNDFIFMCYFLGNDFLPHIPSLDIHSGGIEYMLKRYAETLNEMLLANNNVEYIVEIKKIKKKSKSININTKFLQSFINRLASDESDVLQSSYHKGRKRLALQGDDEYEREVFRIDNLMFKINDPIELGNGQMEEWRARYYAHYWRVMGDELEEFSMKLVYHYMMGVMWVTNYYFDKCPSWAWYYPFDHPPFISDIAKYMDKFDINKYEFKEGEPLKPFMQLMAVLPPQSSFLLPKSLQKIMLNSNSSLAYAYPTEFKQDFINKRRYWMAIPDLPPLDIHAIIHTFNKYKDELNKEEKERNETKEIFVIEV
jgi:5'-3' exonuclease